MSIEPLLEQVPSLIPNAFARVIISPHAQYRGLFKGLIRYLHGLGSKVVILVPNPQRAAYWRDATSDLPGVEFAFNDRRYTVVREPVKDEAAVVARARDYERQLGVTINHLSVADRHLGRGYSLGGFYHPRSRISEESSYIQMVAAFVAELNFWKELFDRVAPTLLVNCGGTGSRFASARGVPYRVLAGSRYESLHQWAYTEHYDNPRIAEAFRRTNDGLPTVKLEQPYTANRLYVSAFERSCRIPSILKLNCYQIVQQVYWKMRGYEKAKGYYLSENLMSAWRKRAAYRAMKGKDTLRLDALRGQPFVYYPLHTEPETALQGLSPEYTFQLETILRVARVLPAGILLAVKDTQFALGRRPRDFYDQIRELKNVRFLNIEERGVDVVTACAAVATITGTAGFEAAVIGKPVITFGAHNQYNFLPHVHIVKDYESLDAAIEAALYQHDGPRACADGAQFLLAVKSVSFDLGAYNFQNPECIESEMIEATASALRASLQSEMTPT